MIRIRDSVRIPGRVRVTYWLIGLNVLAFLATKSGETFVIGGVIPADFSQPDLLNGAYPGVADRRPPALITIFWGMFLHSGFFHLFTNMLTLGIFGPNVEARMGRMRFIFFYLACGAFGFLCQILFDLDSTIPIIGASGAISGLFGAYFVLFPDHFIRITVGRPYRDSWYRDVPLPVKGLLVAWLISQIFYAVLPSPGAQIQVAFFTHLGGFLGGFLLARGRGGGPRPNFRVFTGGKVGHD